MTGTRLRENNDEREAFRQLLEQEPRFFAPAEREAVAAAFFEGRSVRVAAVHLAVNVNTLAHRIKAARATLRLWIRREKAA